MTAFFNLVYMTSVGQVPGGRNPEIENDKQAGIDLKLKGRKTTVGNAVTAIKKTEIAAQTESLDLVS